MSHIHVTYSYHIFMVNIRITLHSDKTGHLSQGAISSSVLTVTYMCASCYTYISCHASQIEHFISHITHLLDITYIYYIQRALAKLGHCAILSSESPPIPCEAAPLTTTTALTSANHHHHHHHHHHHRRRHHHSSSAAVVSLESPRESPLEKILRKKSPRTMPANSAATAAKSPATAPSRGAPSKLCSVFCHKCLAAYGV